MITKLFMLIWCQECYLNNPPSFFKLKLTEISFQDVSLVHDSRKKNERIVNGRFTQLHLLQDSVREIFPTKKNQFINRMQILWVELANILVVYGPNGMSRGGGVYLSKITTGVCYVNRNCVWTLKLNLKM